MTVLGDFPTARVHVLEDELDRALAPPLRERAATSPPSGPTAAQARPWPRRQAPGASPTSRLKARLQAGSDW